MNFSIILPALAAAAIQSAPYRLEAPKAIYFDFGGVMAKPDRQIQLDYVVNELGFPLEAVQNSPYFRWMQLHPEEIDYLSKIAAEKGIALTPGALAAYGYVKRNSVREIPGMREIVARLRQMNFRVSLISNIRAENLDLIGPYREMFDDFIHSASEERDAVWKSELANRGLDPSSILLIDDKEENVEEAMQLGIPSLRFQSAETLRDELSRRQIL